jgi:hypothetical protein
LLGTWDRHTHVVRWWHEHGLLHGELLIEVWDRLKLLTRLLFTSTVFGLLLILDYRYLHLLGHVGVHPLWWRWRDLFPWVIQEYLPLHLLLLERIVVLIRITVHSASALLGMLGRVQPSDRLDYLLLGDGSGLVKYSLADLLHWDVYINAFRHAVLQLYALVWVFPVISDTELIQILYIHIQVHFECYILITA